MADQRILCADSMELLKSFPACDLLLADPPFDMWDVFADLVAQRKDRAVACFTSWQHRAPVEQAMGRPRAEIIWHFADGRWVSHNLPRITHSSILIYGETGAAYVGDEVTDRRPVPKGRGSVGRDRLGERIYVPRERKLLNSVIVAPRNVASGVWTKPDAVVRPIIEWLCPPGGTMFDPFVGGGASLIVARDLGINATGVDIDPAVCAHAESQLASHVVETALTLDFVV
jgi:site-specific DNA-methyltransferase (adenine-specific)